MRLRKRYRQILQVRVLMLFYTFLETAIFFKFFFLFEKIKHRKIAEIVNYLNKNEIAHNVIFVKCVPFKDVISEATNSSENETSHVTLRVVICPKKPAYGNLYTSPQNSLFQRLKKQFFLL